MFQDYQEKLLENYVEKCRLIMLEKDYYAFLDSTKQILETSAPFNTSLEKNVNYKKIVVPESIKGPLMTFMDIATKRVTLDGLKEMQENAPEFESQQKARFDELITFVEGAPTSAEDWNQRNCANNDIRAVIKEFNDNGFRELTKLLINQPVDKYYLACFKIHEAFLNDVEKPMLKADQNGLARRVINKVKESGSSVLHKIHDISVHARNYDLQKAECRVQVAGVNKKIYKVEGLIKDIKRKIEILEKDEAAINSHEGRIKLKELELQLHRKEMYLHALEEKKQKIQLDYDLKMAKKRGEKVDDLISRKKTENAETRSKIASNLEMPSENKDGGKSWSKDKDGGRGEENKVVAKDVTHALFSADLNKFIQLLMELIQTLKEQHKQNEIDRDKYRSFLESESIKDKKAAEAINQEIPETQEELSPERFNHFQDDLSKNKGNEENVAIDTQDINALLAEASMEDNSMVNFNNPEPTYEQAIEQSITKDDSLPQEEKVTLINELISPNFRESLSELLKNSLEMDMERQKIEISKNALSLEADSLMNVKNFLELTRKYSSPDVITKEIESNGFSYILANFNQIEAAITAPVDGGENPFLNPEIKEILTFCKKSAELDNPDLPKSDKAQKLADIFVEYQSRIESKVSDIINKCNNDFENRSNFVLEEIKQSTVKIDKLYERSNQLFTNITKNVDISLENKAPEKTIASYIQPPQNQTYTGMVR